MLIAPFLSQKFEKKGQKAYNIQSFVYTFVPTMKLVNPGRPIKFVKVNKDAIIFCDSGHRKETASTEHGRT